MQANEPIFIPQGAEGGCPKCGGSKPTCCKCVPYDWEYMKYANRILPVALTKNNQDVLLSTGDGERIWIEASDEALAFVVLACNNHQPLIKALTTFPLQGQNENDSVYLSRVIGWRDGVRREAIEGLGRWKMLNNSPIRKPPVGRRERA